MSTGSESSKAAVAPSFSCIFVSSSPKQQIRKFQVGHLGYHVQGRLPLWSLSIYLSPSVKQRCQDFQAALTCGKHQRRYPISACCIFVSSSPEQQLENIQVVLAGGRKHRIKPIFVCCLFVGQGDQTLKKSSGLALVSRGIPALAPLRRCKPVPWSRRKIVWHQGSLTSLGEAPGGGWALEMFLWLFGASYKPILVLCLD